MFAQIKNIICDYLNEKDISLAMILSQEGEILWSYGREIEGANVFFGKGFSRTYILEILKNNQEIIAENVFVAQDLLPESAFNLNIKTLCIFPLKNYYLYIDSGSKKSFNIDEIKFLKSFARLLEDLIIKIKEPSSQLDGLIGDSKETKELRDLIVKYSIENETVLITGETGVGKTYVAELIHRYSGRKGKFIIVNTPSIPENLFESEVFGYKKGAFTDARTDKSGYISEAEGGTLFFDEITEVPLSFQSKLLRLVDSKKFQVLGDAAEQTANVRIVAATNKNIYQLIKENKFRNDLYYRLQILEINIPPLRKRKEDIKSLVLGMKEHLRGKTIGNGFWEILMAYDWPGNVRELINLLIRLGIQGGQVLSGSDVIKVLGAMPGFTEENKTPVVDQLAQELKKGKSFWEVVKEPYSRREINREAVRELIQKYLAEYGHRPVKLLKPFNIDKKDHKKFLNFLNDNHLK